MKLIIDIPKEAFELVKSDTQIDFLNAIHIISTIQNGIPLEEELEKIIEKIDFEEKWLINIKMDNGFISIADIEIAMSGIRSVVAGLKEESKEYEAEVITRGNCMICGKELTEGLFICKDCENKANSRK